MLVPDGQVSLPAHATGGGFDHADIHLPTGRVFVAHTANGAVEIIDGEQSMHRATLGGCQEASGVLCPQKEETVFAASRRTGKILMINPTKLKVKHEFTVDSRPNGLAFDTKRKRLLVADVRDESARLAVPKDGRTIATAKLPGRPRWCLYDRERDRFLVNIKKPAGVAILRAESLDQSDFIRISVQGPHGLDIDTEAKVAFVTCNSESLVALHLETHKEINRIPIPGEPDVLWFNTQRPLLYCAIGKPGIIEVIDTRLFKIVQEIRTEEGMHTFAFDQLRQRLFAFLPRSCVASVYTESM